jgi:hypothetical protein
MSGRPHENFLKAQFLCARQDAIGLVRDVGGDAGFRQQSSANVPRVPEARKLSGLNCDLQCLGADFLDEPLLQFDEFRRGLDLVGSWMR